MLALETLRNLGVKYECLEHYSKGPPCCLDCGCHDLRELLLDHVNGGGNEERRNIGYGMGGHHYYSYLRKKSYPDDLGLEVRCDDCHKKKHKLNPRVKLTYTTTLTIEYDYANPLPDVKELSWLPLWEVSA